MQFEVVETVCYTTTYRVEADSAEEAENNYQEEGDEGMSRVRSRDVDSVTELTVTDQHAAPMAARIEVLARAVAELANYWTEQDLPGDYFDETTGYPFGQDLEELAVNVAEWARLARDRAEERNAR